MRKQNLWRTKMQHLTVGSSRGQMKIQQMAFMLVMIIIFFLLAGLVFFVFYFSSLQGSAETLREKEAREVVKSITGTPELAFTSSRDCTQCIDLDKALILKTMIASGAYTNFWEIDYLVIEKIDGEPEKECTPVNYPECNKVTLIENDQYGLATSSFAALARWDEDMNDFRYEFGRIHASGVNSGS